MFFIFRRVEKELMSRTFGTKKLKSTCTARIEEASQVQHKTQQIFISLRIFILYFSLKLLNG